MSLREPYPSLQYTVSRNGVITSIGHSNQHPKFQVPHLNLVTPAFEPNHQWLLSHLIFSTITKLTIISSRICKTLGSTRRDGRRRVSQFACLYFTRGVRWDFGVCGDDDDDEGFSIICGWAVSGFGWSGGMTIDWPLVWMPISIRIQIHL